MCKIRPADYNSDLVNTKLKGLLQSESAILKKSIEFEKVSFSSNRILQLGNMTANSITEMRQTVVIVRAHKKIFATNEWIKCSVLEIKKKKYIYFKDSVNVAQGILNMVDTNTNEVAIAEKFRLT